jgi:hypothetical protein
MGKQFGPDAVRQEVAGYTLSRFFASSARIVIIVSAALIALPKLGIQVTPFLAAVGALGLGAGLAMQGLLSNTERDSASSSIGHLWWAIQFELRACSA